MEPKRLFVVDAMALVFRSYYAFQGRPLARADGLPTAAIFGSALFLHKLLEEQRPDYVIVASDCQAKTFRHDMYPAYKANRKQMPEDLALQIPEFYNLCDQLGLKVLKQEGFEADDLIGAIATRFANPDLHVYIMSGDKDLMQLVSDHVSLITPKKGQESQLVNAAGVMDKFACAPHQVVDCLALMGDSSDNVPGVPGIGEKGAKTLIQTYGSLENIFANLEDITNTRLRNALSKGEDAAHLSRDLVRLKTDIPLDFDIPDLLIDPDACLGNASLLQFYETMEFNNLQNKVRAKLAGIGLDAPQEESAQPAQAKVQDFSDIARQVNYQRVETRTDLERLLTSLSQQDQYCLDTETTGLDVHGDQLIGMSFSYQQGEAYYIPLHPKHAPFLNTKETLQKLRDFFADNSATIVGHNLKFDLQILANGGLHPKGPFFDTMVASHLLDPLGKQHSLDACCLTHLQYRKIPTSTLIGEKGETSMLEANVMDVTRYACEDADFTMRLATHFIAQLKERDLFSTAVDIEMPLVPILAEMERGGVHIDAPSLTQLSQELELMLADTQTKIFDLAGSTFNIQSPKQLQAVLFETLEVHKKLGITKLKKTKTGYSTDESVLRQLAKDPVCAHILDYRGYAKLKNTYTDVLGDLVHPKTGRLHTHFHQTVTATGRLSSSTPNLQNIPIRTDLGKRVRSAFVPDEGHTTILSADYSQVELRLLAHFAQDKNLIEAFNRDDDIHAVTAQAITGKEAGSISSEDRSRAKAINFGILYGMGPRRLAAETGISQAAAHAFIERYFAAYPQVSRFLEDTVVEAREQGFVRTIGGRIRPLPDIEARSPMIRRNQENIAVNTPIQGSAAELIKKAMAKVAARLKDEGYKTRMLLQVHDELVFSCPQEEKDSVQELIRDSMETAMPLTVRTKVSVGAGRNWREAH